MEISEERLARWRAKAEERKNRRPGHYIERERVAVVLEKWIADYCAEHPPVVDTRKGQPKSSPMEALSFATGVNARALGRIINSEPRMRWKDNGSGYKSLCIDGGEKYLTIDFVDRIFVGINCVHLFHLPPEAGGFSDVYLHPSVVDEAA